MPPRGLATHVDECGTSEGTVGMAIQQLGGVNPSSGRYTLALNQCATARRVPTAAWEAAQASQASTIPPAP